MKRPYSAPNCEYMTFTVDGAIAATNCSYSFRNGDVSGHQYSDGNACWIYGMDGDILFSGSNASCTAETDVYCYYTSAISIFGS